MDTSKDSLKIIVALIDGKCYYVEDFDRQRAVEEGPEYLCRGRGYKINTELTHGIFPYRGEIHKGDKWSPFMEPGIYIKRSKLHPGEWTIKIAYPRNKKQRDEYALDKEQDALAAIVGHEWGPGQFIDLNVNVSKGNGNAFRPPIRVGDDPFNTIMKMAIRAKNAPFEPYGKRLESLAIDRSKGIEGINMRNNARRGLMTNSAMSGNKFVLNADVWELEAAIILKDVEGSSNPMFDEGEMMVIFPNGAPFEIPQDKLIDISDMVREAILENQLEQNEANEELKKKEENDL